MLNIKVPTIDIQIYIYFVTSNCFYLRFIKAKSLHFFDVRLWCNKSSYVARCCLAINRSQTYRESSLIRNIDTVKSGPNCNRQVTHSFNFSFYHQGCLNSNHGWILNVCFHCFGQCNWPVLISHCVLWMRSQCIAEWLNGVHHQQGELGFDTIHGLQS